MLTLILNCRIAIIRVNIPCKHANLARIQPWIVGVKASPKHPQTICFCPTKNNAKKEKRERKNSNKKLHGILSILSGIGQT